MNISNINSLLVYNDNVVAAAGLGGISISNDGGFNWSDASTGLTDMSCYSLGISGTFMFIGTLGGVWYRPLSEIITSVNEKHNVIPNEYSLYQNYPNPFNPSTTITYELPKASFVTLKVFDMLGREIKSLVNGYKSQGKYSVNFNASNLASGVYFYKIESGEYSSIKKMLLLK